MKADGGRLCKKARLGETVERPPRHVRIDRIVTADWSPPEAPIPVEGSKGTYIRELIRALARDLGEKLGVGVRLTVLRRTAIGPFELAESWSLEALTDTLT